MATLQRAEDDARELLNKSWWENEARDRPMPVDPLVLAKSLGIRVEVTFFSGDESGRIKIPARGTPVITLNVFDHENRQRFTCAHEIGHYLSRDRSAGATFIDHRDTLAGMGTDRREIYANQFAAALLMPAHLIRKWCGEGDSVDELARRCQTSVRAMELRLRNLRLQ
jgi:Zn-dependent peptidase ImmA (M78 family)